MIKHLHQIIINDQIHHVVPNEVMILMNDDDQGSFDISIYILRNKFLFLNRSRSPVSSSNRNQQKNYRH
jgi:hypothetical protein